MLFKNKSPGENERILVLAAHPDDEVLGCGGTIARLAADGREVFIAILGEGITSRGNNGANDTAKLKDLHSASRKVGTMLGAQEVFLEKLPDNRFDTVPMLEVVKKIEAILAKVKPTILFTQHGGDLNVDHLVTFRAAMTATRPMTECTVNEVLAYEVGSSTEWAFGHFSPRFHPHVFVDISQTLDVKIQAMETYESEARPFPHPRSPEALRAQAAFRGAQSGMVAAEAFQLVRSLHR